MDLTRWNDADAELEGVVGGDVELLDLSRRLRAARPEPRVDPEFQRRLRAQLMTAAETELRPRGLARLLRPRAHLFAYGAAGMGTAMIAAAALAYYAPHSDHVTVVQGVASINAQHDVSPDDVITISFNQPMDHSSVDRGLKFQPALDYYPPTWTGNELTILPKNHLQPNTPYVITIPKGAARSVSGGVPSQDITITFGTSPVAPPAPAKPAGPASLAGQVAGAVAGGSLLDFGGDGSLLATQGLVPPPDQSGGATTPGAPGGSSTAPAPAPALVDFLAEGPVRLGDPVSAVAPSQAGYQLATISPSADGTRWVVAVSDADGSHHSVLSSAADPGSPLAWGGAPAHPVLLFVSSGQLTTVDLEGHVRSVPGVHLGTGETVLRIAPGGRYVFVGAAPAPAATTPAPPSQGAPSGISPLLPGVRVGSQGGQVAPAASTDSSVDAAPYTAAPDPGRVVDTDPNSGAPALQLAGMSASDGPPAFSADGRRVAWIDRGNGVTPAAIAVEALDGSGTVTHVALPTIAAGDAPTAPVLDFTGDRVAFAVTHADGSAVLRLVHVADGAVLGTATVHQPSGLAFSLDGTKLAYIAQSNGQTVAEIAQAPGAPAGVTSVPRAANTAIQNLVAAEVAGDRDALSSLVPQTSLGELLSHLPSTLSRGYVISAVPSADGQTVTAQIRLLRDPTSDHPMASFTDQSVVLQSAGSKYVVLSSSIPQPLQDEKVGPQVIQVDTTHLLTLTTVRITFDSDIDPTSVNNQLVSLEGATSSLTQPSVSYDPSSRTVVVTFVGRFRQPLTLDLGIGLRDVNGQGLAGVFQTEVAPGR